MRHGMQLEMHCHVGDFQRDRVLPGKIGETGVLHWLWTLCPDLSRSGHRSVEIVHSLFPDKSSGIEK